jgi:hypothetical protein
MQMQTCDSQGNDLDHVSRCPLSRDAKPHRSIPTSLRASACREGLESDGLGHRVCIGDTISPTSVHRLERKDTHMNYGIGGILILILVILAIVFFAQRV